MIERTSRHSVYSKLHDDDLLLAMEAVRRELKNPQPSSSYSMLDDRRGALQLVASLAMMQDELNIRLAEKEARREP